MVYVYTSVCYISHEVGSPSSDRNMDKGRSIIVNMDKGKSIIEDPVPPLPLDGLDAHDLVPPLPSSGLGAHVPVPPLPSGGLGAHVHVPPLPSSGLGAHVPMPQVLLYLVGFEWSMLVLCYPVTPFAKTIRNITPLFVHRD